MIDSPFFKFPSTPHLMFASGHLSRADKLLSPVEKELLLSNIISIEEKVDGANLGISFSKSGELLLQNRGQYLLPPYLGQWEKLPAWLNIYLDRLFDVLEDKFILFGEWCYAKHSLHYTRLPNWLISFDVFDLTAQKFYSVSRRNELVNRIGLPIIPLIRYGSFSLSDIPSLLKKSMYGDCPCEGLYFRYDLDGWLHTRAKYVRNDFSQAIECHWKNLPIKKNRIMKSLSL